MRHQGQCQRCQQDNQHGTPALPTKALARAAGHGVLATPPGASFRIKGIKRSSQHPFFLVVGKGKKFLSLIRSFQVFFPI